MSPRVSKVSKAKVEVAKTEMKPKVKEAPKVKEVGKSRVEKVKETKAVEKVEETETEKVKMTEEMKKSDENYILNPNTNKSVLKTSSIGKKLVSGEEIKKMMTETERLVLVIQTCKDYFKLKDSELKKALSSVIDDLPRSFPNVWGGKQKIARHKDHPKQPSNSYIFYTKEAREKVNSENPEAKNTEIVSILAKQWKELKNKDKYVEMANEDKIRYTKDMEKFEKNHPEFTRSKTSKKNSKPTKETAYRLFCEKNREQLKKKFPESTGKEITQKLASEWKKEKEDSVLNFQKKAEEMNKDFEERMTEYLKTASPKLSKSEQAKAEDTEHFELNTKTGRYVNKVKKSLKKVEKEEIGSESEAEESGEEESEAEKEVEEKDKDVFFDSEDDE